MGSEDQQQLQPIQPSLCCSRSIAEVIREAEATQSKQPVCPGNMILVTYSRPKDDTEILLEEQLALLINREELKFELLCSLLMYFQDTDPNQASPRRDSSHVCMGWFQGARNSSV